MYTKYEHTNQDEFLLAHTKQQFKKKERPIVPVIGTNLYIYVFY